MRATTILGLDYGERRIGVALSDPEKTLAVGVGTIDTRREDPFVYLQNLIDEENVEAVVVGYPLRTDGLSPPGAKTEAVDAFIARLERRFGLPVHREDESFTSRLAQESLEARRGKRRKRRHEKEAVDRVAACYILQDYLDRNRP